MSNRTYSQLAELATYHFTRADRARVARLLVYIESRIGEGL